jgi:hypothetical protein
MRFHGLGKSGEIVGLHVIRHGVFAALGEIMGGLQTDLAAGGLTGMELDSLVGSDDDHQVVGLGKRSVVGTGTGHVHDTLLRGYETTGGQDHCAIKDEGFSLSDRVDVTDPAGEYLVGTFYLAARLDSVFHRKDTNVLPGMRQIQVEICDSLDTGEHIDHFLLVDGEDTVFNGGLLTENQLVNLHLMEFEFQSDSPLLKINVERKDERRA